ncbi:MAG: chemotaxis protein CheW [Gemmatimonadetes bacterium]|jgi:purine-binding chemotaxis protein CheW|nr:chemotaxis protein CheW [Gemmatimonadota bacterium]
MTPRAPAIRLVTFGIGDAWYAAEIAYVERVLRHEGVHPVPNMPPWMEGVLEHQGRIVPVIDLRRRFGLVEGDGRAPTSGGGRLLLLSLGADVVAAAVDRVVDVRAVAEGEIASPPRLVRGVAGEFLKGMVRRDDVMVLVLDIPRLLSPDEHLALDGCVPPPAAAVVAAAGSLDDA